MHGDNFNVRVVSEGREHLEAAVKLAWENCPGGKATHYMTPIPAGPCGKCLGTGKRWYWKDKESFEFACEECQGSGQKPERAGIVLLWHEDHIKMQPALRLPFPLTVEAAVNFLWDWLAGVEYPHEPDHDGSNGKGFIVTTGDFWGHNEGSHYAFIGVYPNWQMHGK